MVKRPLKPDELLEQCDLAGEARVLEIIPNPRGYGMIARLRFRKIAKGRIRRFPGETRRVVIVRLRGSARGSSGEPILGEWSDHYEAGTTVFTHLEWDTETNAYQTSWWNAVRTVRENESRKSGIAAFLRCFGLGKGT